MWIMTISCCYTVGKSIAQKSNSNAQPSLTERHGLARKKRQFAGSNKEVIKEENRKIHTANRYRKKKSKGRRYKERRRREW